MSGTEPSQPSRPGPPEPRTPEPEHAERRALNEDWLATAVGLILLALVLAGVITNALVP